VPVQRIRLTVRYDGTDFAGSQIQPGQRTVAGTLTTGLETLLRHPVRMAFAGRTDAGVHANGNVACFTAELCFPLARLPRLLQAYLPRDVRVIEVSEVAEDFNPRHHALYREYSYVVYRGGPPPVDRLRYVWDFRGNFEALLVDEVFAGILGKHSFHNFCAGSPEPEMCQCEIFQARCTEAGPEVAFTFTGNRFLHGMIRRLIAAVMAAADGQVAASQVLAALTGPMTFKLKPAPPQGLTLERVVYPGEGEHPAGIPRVDGIK
jgi:tRNA pseudouridine38-40 synthase